MYTVMEYSTITPTNNKIARTNIISQNTSVIDEHSSSVADIVTVFDFAIAKR